VGAAINSSTSQGTDTWCVVFVRSSMFFQERLAMKPVLAYEKTQDGRVKTKDSSWKEGVAQHGDSVRASEDGRSVRWLLTRRCQA
jgi:hypothetical protein